MTLFIRHKIRRYIFDRTTDRTPFVIIERFYLHNHRHAQTQITDIPWGHIHLEIQRRVRTYHGEGFSGPYAAAAIYPGELI